MIAGIAPVFFDDVPRQLPMVRDRRFETLVQSKSTCISAPVFVDKLQLGMSIETCDDEKARERPAYHCQISGGKEGGLSE